MKAAFGAINLLDHLYYGVIAVDNAGVVRFVNSAGERILGRPRKQLLGQELKRLLPGFPVALELLDRACAMNAPCRLAQGRLRPSPWETLNVSLTATPLFDQNGRGAGAILQLEERGSALRLEEGERLEEAIDSMGSLALAIAHEVKNPLAGINGAAQLLEMESSEEWVKNYTGLIRAEVERVGRMLDNLMGIADTPPGGRKTTVNIHEVLDHVLTLTGEQGAVRDFDPSLPGVSAERDKLIQVFLNLVTNGRQAAGAGGEVRVHTRISNQIRLEGGRRKLTAVVEVRDNGPGVEPELQKRIFMPFVTTKPKGMGLGLPISQKIIRDHGGSMEFERQGGQTIFRVFLPVGGKSELDEVKSPPGEEQETQTSPEAR